MASTNKTTNLLLSQFLGTDHFSFLTDYNGDMLKIDTYCGNLKSLIDGNTSQIGATKASLENIESDVQSMQSVQETQNGNITKNTQDIGRLDAKTTQNTNEIEQLKQGSVYTNGYDLRLTYNNRTPSNYRLCATYDANMQAILIRGEEYTWNKKTNLLKPNADVTISLLNIPVEIRSQLKTKPVLRTNCGVLCGEYVVVEDGENITRPWTVPLKGQFVFNTEGDTVVSADFIMSCLNDIPSNEGILTYDATMTVYIIIPLGGLINNL